MRLLTGFIAISLILLIGCSSGVSDPVQPVERNMVTDNTHSIWGLWQFTIDPENQTLSATELRTGSLHLNALPYLEPPTALNLTVENTQFIGGVVETDVGLRHPFLGMPRYTGFDVCGILITSGSYLGYGDPELVFPAGGNTRILNPDGYTRWWNPVEFPVNDGTIFSYTDGLLGVPDSIADFNCTVNGYKYFCDDLEVDDPLSVVDPAGRAIFWAGQKNYRHYEIAIGSGLVFNYAIDASWQQPTGSPPFTVPDDFGPGANRPEAWRIEVNEIENTLYNDGIESGGDLRLAIDVYDWFNAEMNTVKFDSSGIPATMSSSTPSGGGVGYSTYEIEILGANPPIDEMELLITVECEQSGYGGLLPGKAVSSYFLHNVTVDTSAPAPIGWARNWGGNSDRGFGVAADDAGNSYTTGYFDGTSVDFDPSELGEDLHSAVGGDDICLSKFDTNGNFVWARTWGGSSNDEGHGVCVDENGDVYVTGFFKGSADFDTGPGEDIKNSIGAEDSFLTKYSASGEYQWTEIWGGNDSHYSGMHYQNHPYFGDCGFGVDTDGAGNVYVAGTGFDLGVGIGFSYVIKYDTDGTYQWRRTWGSSDFDKAFDVAVYGTDEIYVTGRFDGVVDFHPGPDEAKLTAHDAHDSYLTKFNSSGDHQWARGWGGNDKHTGYSNPTTHYSDGGYGVDVDTSGNIFITGEYYGTVDFDPGPGDETHPNLGTGGYGDAYLTVFDSNGDFLWVNVWGGQHFQKGYGIDVNDSGSVYISGRFYNTVDFNTGPGVDEHSSSGDADIYISKFDTSGNWQWTRSFGSTSYEAGTSVASDGFDNSYMTGYFRGAIDFDPGLETYELTNNVQEDIYLLKLLPNGYWE